MGTWRVRVHAKFAKYTVHQKNQQQCGLTPGQSLLDPWDVAQPEGAPRAPNTRKMDAETAKKSMVEALDFFHL